MRKHVCSSERAGVISDHIAGVMINDVRPINLMAGQGFKDLMAYLEPGYHLPSPIHFTHLIKRKYGAVKERVQSQLQQHAEFMAIIADLWASVALGSYLTVHLVQCCSLPKIGQKSHIFGFGATQRSTKGEAHKLSLCSDVVWLSLYAQHKFHMDLNFPSAN